MTAYSVAIGLLVCSCVSAGAVWLTVFCVASQRCRAMNSRLREIGEVTCNWMNPAALIGHRARLKRVVPGEYRAVTRIYMAWFLICVFLALLLNAVLILSALIFYIWGG